MAALSGFTTGHDKLKRPAQNLIGASRIHALSTRVGSCSGGLIATDEKLTRIVSVAKREFLALASERRSLVTLAAG